MIYIVASDEILLRDEQIDKIVQQHEKNNFPSPRKFFLGDEAQHNLILSEMNNLSLFNEKKSLLLICHNLPLGVDTEKALIEVVASAGDDELIILSMPRLAPAIRNKKWFKIMTSSGKNSVKGEYIALYAPSGTKLTVWLRDRARAIGINLDNEAVEFLAQSSEGNLLGGVQELEKLKLAYGEELLTYEKIRQVTGDSSNYDVFSLSDTVLAGDIPRCRRILNHLQLVKEPPTKVIWLLAKDIDMLSTISARPQISNQELYKFGCFGPRQTWARQLAGKFAGPNRSKLKMLLKLLAKADQAAKGGSQDDCWQLIEAICLRLAGLPTPAAVAYLRTPAPSFLQ